MSLVRIQNRHAPSRAGFRRPGARGRRGGAAGQGGPRAAERQAAVARVRRAVATAVDRRGVLAPGEVILIGCSGGPDSTTLLDALARLAPARGWRLAVAHVDHGLRAESASEAGRVADLAEARDLPFR